MLDGEIESSLELLDLCNTTQEIFVELKAIIQELQMALRKGDNATVQARIHSYIRMVKKARQHFKASKKATSDKTDCAMIRLLSKARETTISLLESTLQLLSKQIEVPKQSLGAPSLYLCVGDLALFFEKVEWWRTGAACWRRPSPPPFMPRPWLPGAGLWLGAPYPSRRSSAVPGRQTQTHAAHER
nr:unnamed protein product [Digitaria exilis]